MKLGRKRLAEVFYERLQSGSINERELSHEIAAYLLAEGRSGELDSILRDIKQLRADAGVIEVLAKSAHSLSTSERTEIEQLVRKQHPNAQNIIISETIDPHMMGGVKLEFANEQWDLSVRAKLNRFKQLTAATGGL